MVQTRVVVGIPTRNEAPTIPGVVAAVERGLWLIGCAGDALLINADNASSDGTSDLFLNTPGICRRTSISTGPTGGKGTNVLAILRTAQAAGAQTVLLLDGDVRSIDPSWIGALMSAVRVPEPVLAVPVYRRNRYEGNTTHHIASPLIAAVLGVDVQQPIAGDFALNGALVERAVAWPVPDSAQLYGIDVHLTANTAREGHRIVQVPLGRKIHNPGFPKILHMSQQVVDSLFHVLSNAGRPRQAEQAVGQARRDTVDPVAIRPDGALIVRTVAKVMGYLRRYRHDIPRVLPSAAHLASAPWGYDIGAGAWAELVADAMEALASGRHAVARDHLVALYLCRVLSYWREIEEAPDGAAIDDLLDRQSAAVVDAVRRRSLAFTPLSERRFAAGYWAEDGDR